MRSTTRIIKATTSSSKKAIIKIKPDCEDLRIPTAYYSVYTDYCLSKKSSRPASACMQRYETTYLKLPRCRADVVAQLNALG